MDDYLYGPQKTVKRIRADPKVSLYKAFIWMRVTKIFSSTMMHRKLKCGWYSHNCFQKAKKYNVLTVALFFGFY